MKRSFWEALVFEQDGDLNLGSVFLAFMLIIVSIVAIRNTGSPWAWAGLVAIITALIAGSTIYNKTKIVKGTEDRPDGH